MVHHHEHETSEEVIGKVIIMNSELYGLIFATLSLFGLLFIFALLDQRKRSYSMSESMQTLWINQIYDPYLIRSKTLEIQINQLEQHRQALEKIREQEQR